MSGNNIPLIATHDSATGEKGSGLISWLVTPFARTQCKTIKQQHDAGCTMFDIRVKQKGKEWRCAHGLWKTKQTVEEILFTINTFKDSYVCITYEGVLKNESEKAQFCGVVNHWKEMYPNIFWGPVAVKYGEKGIKVDWINLMPADKWALARQGFIPLDGNHWQTYIPIPWLWDKIYTTPHMFDNEVYTFVDFL